MLSETQSAQRSTSQPCHQRTALAVIAHRERGLALQRLMSLYGYSLLIAADADTAFALAEAYTPDLLLLDCCLPDDSALTAFARLRAEAPFAQAPIIMLDTLPDAASGAVWLAWGAAAYAPTLPNCAALEAALAALPSASGPSLPPATPQPPASQLVPLSRAVGASAWQPPTSARPLAARLRAAM
jgi:DNA-binding response OmpR family regulator